MALWLEANGQLRAEGDKRRRLRLLLAVGNTSSKLISNWSEPRENEGDALFHTANQLRASVANS